MKPLNLLLKNPLLQKYTLVDNLYINEKLGGELRIPDKLLFSSFALSIDGKLCYPDTPSGFTIAKANSHACPAEKDADWWFLMLARSISDAMIIGSNSLNLEGGKYTPDITIPELIQMRLDKKSSPLWTIVITRNMASLNLKQELFTNPKYPVMILCFDKANCTVQDYAQIKISRLSSREQLANKNIIEVDTEFCNILPILRQLDFNIILNESPFFHHKLLEHKLLDEIWLNYSGSYIGGAIKSLGDKQDSFTSLSHPDTEILTLHHIDYHFLYSRQKILYAIHCEA
jgi:riboflavin biosynthesis pyrimidine reductase